MLSAPLDDDDNSAEPVAASSSGSARKRQRTSDNSATSASASLSDRENRTEVDEQISSGLGEQRRRVCIIDHGKHSTVSLYLSPLCACASSVPLPTAAVLKDTADDIASVLLEEGPKLSRALRDAHDTAVVVRACSPSGPTRKIASCTSVVYIAACLLAHAPLFATVNSTAAGPPGGQGPSVHRQGHRQHRQQQ